MPLLSGSMSLRRFTLAIDPEHFERLSWAQTVDHLTQHAFQPPPIPSSAPVIGWVSPDNPIDTDFSDPNLWRFDPYILLSFRVDVRKINTTLRNARLARAVRAWCTEQSTQRCPASIKTELREQIDAEMLRATTPTTRVYEVLWNTAESRTSTWRGGDWFTESWIVLGSLSDKVTEIFRKLFHGTFGITLSPLDPLTLLTDERAEALRQATVMPIPDFLHWFWFASDRSACIFSLPQGQIDAWVDSRIMLREKNGGANVAVLTGENPSGTREARAALVGGKVPTELRLGIRRDRLDYTATIRGAHLDLSSISLPGVAGDTLDETLRVRALAYEELWGHLVALFRLYAIERLSDEWPTTQKAMKAWSSLDSPDNRDANRFQRRSHSFDAEVSRT